MAEARIDNIPPPRVEFIDPRTGLIAREWYRFFLDLFTRVGEDSTIIREDFSLSAFDNPAAFAALATLSDQISAAELRPGAPAVAAPAYGSFAALLDQTAAVINTAYVVDFDDTLTAAGMAAGSAGEIIVTSPGVYAFRFVARLTKASAGTANAWVWPRVNGANVANSATMVQITGGGAQQPLSGAFLLTLAAGDEFELMWAASSTAVLMDAQAAAAPVPAIPAASLTVTKVS